MIPSRKNKIKSMIRVDHAGEFGAQRIYDGQLAVFRQIKKKKNITKKISYMAEQEKEHLDFFNRKMHSQKIRPTAFMPLWNVLGYALGVGTALMSEKHAMLCTYAVEDAIDDHYAKQIDELNDKSDEGELKKRIYKFREDEIEHRDTAINFKATEARGFNSLSKVINKGTKLAIWISERI